MAAPASVGPGLDIDKALEEVLNIPVTTLHRSAAFTWGARAIACYRVCVGAAQGDRIRYYLLGEHYREAGLAHAAMDGLGSRLYTQMEKAMAVDRATAYLSTDAPPSPTRPQRRRGRRAR